jgi:hypothetical protein
MRQGMTLQRGHKETAIIEKGTGVRAQVDLTAHTEEDTITIQSIGTC